MEKWFKGLDKAEQFWVIFIGIILFYLCFFYPNQIDWSVDRTEEYTVQVFPDSNNTKNYELPVDMDITEHRNGFRHSYIEYDVSRVTFPNEGYLEFESCIAKDTKMTNCTDQDGAEWGVKVLVTPDKPESDSYSEY